MKMFQLTPVMLAVAMGLGACGGGGSSSSGSGAASSKVVGVVTGFGSVYVNGVEYETGGASVTMDGNPAAETDLQVGMVVTLEGTTNANGTTGSASTVVFSDDLEGVVLSNDIAAGADAGTLNIMGQTVTVTATTRFDSDVAGITAPHMIVAGNVVEVSGFPDGNGNIAATRIEVKRATMAGESIELKGVVTALDSTAMTFMLGSLTIDYSAAGSVPSNLADGLYVEVQSDAAPTDSGTGFVLVASSIEIEGDGSLGVDCEEGEDVHLQGLVTAIDVAAGTVTVNGQVVQIRLDDEEDMAFLSTLQVGSMVRLEARLIDGVLVVKDIENDECMEGDTEFQGTVEAVDLEAKTFTLLGQTILVNNNTMVDDERDEGGYVPEHYFDLSDLAVGDYVEVRAYLDANSQLVAVEVERDDDHSGGVVELKGSVTSLDPLQVSGVTVDLSAVADVVPALGMVLEITGTMSGTTLVATEATVDG